MCRWRDLAIQHLPNLRETALAATSHVDLWQLFKELLAEAGISESRRAEAESIYKYAWWCIAGSHDPDLAAAVETFFYEDLPYYSDFEEQVPMFIAPMQFKRLERSFANRLTEEEFADFRSRYYTKRAKNSAANTPQPQSGTPFGGADRGMMENGPIV